MVCRYLNVPIYVIKYNPTHVIITPVWQGRVCADNYLRNHKNHVRIHTKVGTIQYIYPW